MKAQKNLETLSTNSTSLEPLQARGGIRSSSALFSICLDICNFLGVIIQLVTLDIVDSTALFFQLFRSSVLRKRHFDTPRIYYHSLSSSYDIASVTSLVPQLH